MTKQLLVMDQAVRNGEFKIRYKGLPRDLRGKTLGLLGFGRIGSELGRCCREFFDMRVVSHDPYVPETARAGCKGQVGFENVKNSLNRPMFCRSTSP